MESEKLILYPLVLTLVLFLLVGAGYHSPQPGVEAGEVSCLGPDTLSQKPGMELYLYACVACHGVTGRGVPQGQLGINTPVPDFTDCDFASREPDSDWIAVTHQGGPVRGFAKEMPAFGKALSEEELQKVMTHIRTFCGDDNWPRGELNLPRPLVTEKAYPEDEAVISTSIDMENEGLVMNEVVYEHRLGARNQLEVVVPFGFRQSTAGKWGGGQLGDMAVGIKRALYHNINSGSIFSVTGEVIIPTGDRLTGFGKGTTIFEPFFSFGQILPAGSFLQIQSGMELPMLREKAKEEAFWRGVVGTSLTQRQWGRTWSPMVEILGARELEVGAVNHWDIIPQVQVTLNKRQHIMMNVGVRIPVDDAGRDTQLMVYILWDWFDGGIFEGW
ncbi:c-type cytochrome [Fodinibius salsisoli]|uniref:Cytochrome c n=1 Tax=Fodinibius salsisoli TaxID=2820877 RepID=A0ABT3PIG0_9BACT|nr:c-type cytochrome [Fodinibius salsisoli]MCW9705707.1 cytochrome c [Fodinibius salsisoli]